MKKPNNLNPGGVNGMGNQLIDSQSEEMKLLKEKIRIEAAGMSRTQKLENQVLEVRIRMQEYLSAYYQGELKGVGDFLGELLSKSEIQQNAFAKYVGIQAPNLNAIIKGKRKISSKLSLQLADIFKIPAETWLGIQAKNELAMAQQLLQEEEVEYRLRDLLD